jgi:biopolymer transport protein ExbB
MEKVAQDQQSNSLKSMFTMVAIPVIIAISVLLFIFVLGDGSNFEGGSNENHPLKGNYLGMVYKGGFIVPILMSFLLMVFVFSIERFFTINAANGNGSVETFIRKVKSLLVANKISEAKALCDVQKGSVGNVIKAVLTKYEEVAVDTKLEKDQKIAAIQQELEDATSLELPMLEKNLTIISTMASVATLVALLGTVLGMIKAFAAMSNAGAPDASALATGISEALINTAIGIGTSAIAIIAYNFFTSKIDTLTYSIDEAGMSITQNFSSHNK